MKRSFADLLLRRKRLELHSEMDLRTCVEKISATFGGAQAYVVDQRFETRRVDMYQFGYSSFRLQTHEPLLRLTNRNYFRRVMYLELYRSERGTRVECVFKMSGVAELLMLACCGLDCLLAISAASRSPVNYLVLNLLEFLVPGVFLILVMLIGQLWARHDEQLLLRKVKSLLSADARTAEAAGEVRGA